MDPYDTFEASDGDELRDPQILCDWLAAETADRCTIAPSECRFVFCVESSGVIGTSDCRHDEGSPRVLTNDATLDDARLYCEGGENAWMMTDYNCPTRPQEFADASIASCLYDAVDL